MLTKKENHIWIIGIIIFMAILLISSPVIQADDSQIYSFYNLPGTFWYPVISPMFPIAGEPITFVNSLINNTLLSFGTDYFWGPINNNVASINFVTPRTSGNELLFLGEHYGLNLWPSLSLIDTMKSFTTPIGLLADLPELLPSQPITFATMNPAFIAASQLLDWNNTNNMERADIFTEGLESYEDNTYLHLETDQLSQGSSFTTNGEYDNPITNSRFRSPMLRMAFIEAESIGKVKELARMGIDIAAIRKGPVVESEEGIPIQTYRVEAVISALDEKSLAAEGIDWSEVPGKGPVKKIGEAYNFYHSFDEPINGIKAQLQTINAQYPKIAQLKAIGRSIQQRPILAIGLTNEKIRGDKPQVLFLATHHAREWIATEMAMRLIKYLASNYGSDARVTNLLDTTEVWIIPVANPDGYQFTFTTEQLWRKNLRDNDDDGLITIADGVDLNRNFDSRWGLDNEGSSPYPSAGNYRGPEPNSEPETQAVADFVIKNDFKFILTYHSFSNLIFYPWIWQVRTTSLDDPIFVAQAGTQDNPAIWDSLIDMGYDTGTGADLLYISNGDFVEWCYNVAGVPAYCVELTSGHDAEGNNYGFAFPDDDSLIQTVVEDNLPFALALAESAANPAHPVSPVGIVTQDIYHTPLTASYGSDQIIQVLARKGLDMTLYFSINGGSEQTASFTEKLGAFYNEKPGVYYSRYQAVISGQSGGDSVAYRIAGGVAELGPYTYNVVSATGNPIIVMAAEDYTGPVPDYPGPGPHYINYYTDALDAVGYTYDVWDVDYHMAAPSYIEVLSHYDAVIWYTGDDIVPLVPYLGVHEEEVLNVRDFMNYSDGKLFATGQGLAMISAVFGAFPDDFFQYYMGAYLHIEGGGMNQSNGLPFEILGIDGDPIFNGLTFSIHGGSGANNQHHADSFLLTNSFLPHFNNTMAALYDRLGGPFDPHSGSYYVYSQMADQAYKRLGGTFTLPTDSPTLEFWISYDTETNWDFAFVEISESGTDIWTTLPDLYGMTTTNTGDGCPDGWALVSLHPFLAHYMDIDCNPTGTTGTWNALTGNSGGWQQVEMDLSAYAGKTVELYISYVSDWAIQNLGVFIDDIEISGLPLEDFEAGMGQWNVSTAPGSLAHNNWERISGGIMSEGPAIRTPNSVYLGFGFEAIDTATNRNTVMERVMDYFGL